MSDLSAETKSRVLSELAEQMTKADCALDFDGPMKVTVRRHDGTFTNLVVEPGCFLVERFFLAKDGEEIFAFTPEDPNDLYEAVEVRAKKVDGCFPELLEALLAPIVVRSAAQERARRDELLTAETVPELMRMFWKLEVSNEAVAVESDSDGMKSNPVFGMF